MLSFELYGEDVKSNLLLNVSEEHSVLPTILQFLFIAIAVVHIPLIFFAGKEAVLIIFDEITRKSYSQPLKVDSMKDNISVTENKIFDSRSIHGQEKSIEFKSRNSQINSERNIEKSDDGEDEKEDNEEHIQDMPVPESEMFRGEQSSENCLRSNNIKEKLVLDQSKDANQRTASATASDPVVVFKPNPKEYLNMKPLYYYLVTIILYFVVVLLSIVVGDVKIFFGIIGSSTGCFVTFFAPGSFYLISLHKTNSKIKSKCEMALYVLAYVYAVVGVIGIFAFNT